MHLAAALAERTPQPQASESQGSREPLDAWYNFLRVNSAIRDDALHGGWNLLHDLDDARFAHSKGLSEQISEWRPRNGEFGKKRSLLESVPVLILLGLLVGAAGAVGIGLIQLRAMSQASSARSGTK